MASEYHPIFRRPSAGCTRSLRCEDCHFATEGLLILIAVTCIKILTTELYLDSRGAERSKSLILKMSVLNFQSLKFASKFLSFQGFSWYNFCVAAKFVSLQSLCLYKMYAATN